MLLYYKQASKKINFLPNLFYFIASIYLIPLPIQAMKIM